MKKIKYIIILIFIFLNTSCTNMFVKNSNNSSEIIINEEVSYDKDGFAILNSEILKENVFNEKDKGKVSKVKAISYPEGATLNKEMKMYIYNEEVPIYNVKTNKSHTFTANNYLLNDSGVAMLQLEGKVKIIVVCSFVIDDSCVIRPLEKGITYQYNKEYKMIQFEINSTGQYTIEFKNRKTLHLFVDEITDYSTYENQNNVIYLKKGIYNKNNCTYINSENNFVLNSNQTLVLDYGAIIQGSIVSYYSSNVKVLGGGIIDGSTFIRDANTNQKQIPLSFEYCQDFTISGLSFLDPAGWCLNLYFDQNLTIDNVKIISSRANGDGVSLQSCKNAIVKNCFVRSWDDSLVVKNYPHWLNRNNHGATENISFENCLIWTDLAQSMEIGYETVGEVMKNIKFKNIIVLHNYHLAPISIHNANNAIIENVSYENITIEDASSGGGNGSPYLVDIKNVFSQNWSTNHTTTSLGRIKDVTLKNILIIDGKDNLSFVVLGCVDDRDEYKNSVHEIDEINFIDILYLDQKIDEKQLITNEYVKKINIDYTGDKITGANFINLNNVSDYGDNLIILKEVK